MRAELIPLIEKLIAKTKERKLYWKDITADLTKEHVTIQHEFKKCIVRVSRKAITQNESRYKYSRYSIYIEQLDGRKASMIEYESDHGGNIESLPIKELYYSAAETCASVKEVSIIDSIIEELDHINKETED
jgi:hypothetical protein